MLWESQQLQLGLQDAVCLVCHLLTAVWCNPLSFTEENLYSTSPLRCSVVFIEREKKIEISQELIMSNLISSSLSLMPPEEIFHIESHVYYHYAGLILLRWDIIWSTVDSINITSDKKITYKVYPHQNVPLTDKYLNVTLFRISQFSCPTYMKSVNYRVL